MNPSPHDVILEVNGVSKSFGGVQALDTVDLRIHRNQITALIGPNGAGKTTLVNVMTGIYQPDRGSVVFEGSDIGHQRASTRARGGIARTFQRVRLFPQLSVLENALSFRWTRSIRRIDRVMKVAALDRLDQFGLSHHASDSPEQLTFADRRRLEIVRCLLAQPKVMMLDEPAAGMNPEEASTFVRQIARLQIEEELTLLLIEHNMTVVMGLAHFIYVLNFGQIIASGTPTEVRTNPAVIEAYLGATA